MGRKGKYLDKQAREFVEAQMLDSGEMSKEEVKDLVRPHFMFDYQTAKEQAINRYVNGLISSLRDEQGVRTNFILRGKDSVVNLEKSNNLRNVRAVEEQLRKQIVGTMASYKKAKKRAAELEGQASIFDNTTARDVFDFGTNASV